ncbi:hypothetical protein YC2023_069978 [Brassica napus]
MQTLKYLRRHSVSSGGRAGPTSRSVYKMLRFKTGNRYDANSRSEDSRARDCFHRKETSIGSSIVITYSSPMTISKDYYSIRLLVSILIQNSKQKVQSGLLHSKSRINGPSEKVLLLNGLCFALSSSRTQCLDLEVLGFCGSIVSQINSKWKITQLISASSERFFATDRFPQQNTTHQPLLRVHDHIYIFLYINKVQLTSKSKESLGKRFFFRYRSCFKWVGKANSEELALLADKQARLKQRPDPTKARTS